ncbi:endonuclease domain-containing protein [Kocuria flava]|uniref:endonuclease domain-containing protein n=1 Tax=Kocuria flava TaxID=446860 RepID=UPI001FF2AFB5|nr:endonuclease domain-containing protein [Kocuria flava]MCJ8506055.1 endonuclease domain-containing protein [Kocuria flava]
MTPVPDGDDDPGMQAARLVRSARSLAVQGWEVPQLPRGVATGRLVRLRCGVYAPAAWHDLPAEQQDLGRIHAVAVGALRPPVFSHGSAALLHGLRVLHPDGEVHVCRPRGTGTHNSVNGVRNHHLELPAADVVELQGLRATSLERTALDCARFWRAEDALVLLDQAARRGVDPGVLTARLAAMPGRRGVRAARWAVGLMDGRAESVGESLTRLLLARAQLPPPVLQLEIPTPLGVFRPDFAWPGSRLILEFDGRGKYFLERPTAEVLLRERRRETQLTNLGWRVLRTDWDELVHRPDRLVHAVTVDLARGRSRR